MTKGGLDFEVEVEGEGQDTTWNFAVGYWFSVHVRNVAHVRPWSKKWGKNVKS